MSGNEIQSKDWLEYKERVFFQLDGLEKGHKELISKYDLMREDIIKVKTNIENHPLLCPLNPDEIIKLAQDEIRDAVNKYPNFKDDLERVDLKLKEFEKDADGQLEGINKMVSDAVEIEFIKLPERLEKLKLTKVSIQYNKVHIATAIVIAIISITSFLLSISSFGKASMNRTVDNTELMQKLNMMLKNDSVLSEQVRNNKKLLERKSGINGN